MVKCSSFGTAGGSHFYFFFRQNSWWKPRRGFVGLDVNKWVVNLSFVMEITCLSL